MELEYILDGHIMEDSKSGWQEQKDGFSQFYDWWIDSWVAYLMALRISSPFSTNKK